MWRVSGRQGNRRLRGRASRKIGGHYPKKNSDATSQRDVTVGEDVGRTFGSEFGGSSNEHVGSVAGDLREEEGVSVAAARDGQMP